MNTPFIKRRLTRTTIYSSLVLVVGWFASQGCFPVYSPPIPVVTPTPCPSNANGQVACPSPAPPQTTTP